MRKYESKEARIALAKRIAAESIVLLQNQDNVLPLQKGKKVALFGRSQLETKIGGSGSGASSSDEATNILDECIRAGLAADTALAEYYRDFVRKAAEEEAKKENPYANLGELIASGLIYEIFGLYSAPEVEAEIPAGLLAEAAAQTDTAICVIGRVSGGEECDRYEENDYYLIDSEKQMIDAVCENFSKVIVVLNINGAVDLSWVREKESVKSVLFMGTPGEQGAAALADVLVGGVSPSGRLSETFALSYGDYPTAEDFSFNKQEPEKIKEYKHYGLDAEANGSKGFAKSPVTVYREGIYMGYRYFDTFGKEVLYPFGYGLSYAVFTQKVESVVRDGSRMKVRVTVQNVSENGASGKDVVQVYVSIPAGKLEQPYKKLIGFAKTGLLAEGESETLELSIPLTEFASYEEASASYIMEAGDYVLRVGSISCDTHVAAIIRVTEEITVVKYANRLKLRSCNEGKIDFLSAKDNADAKAATAAGHYAGEAEELAGAAVAFELNAADGAVLADSLTRMKKVTAEDVNAEPSKEYRETGIWQFSDVKNGLVSLRDFVAQMSVEELAVLANGYGPGLPFGGAGGKYPTTIQYEDGTDIAVCSHKAGFPGYVSPSLPKYGIPSAFYKDGPAGVRLVAWPTGMLIGCSFDPQIAYEFGSACGWEAESQLVDSWLAPAVNLLRNPLGGRSFEYFSEDPYVSGIMGLMITRGAEENNHVTTCPKHFALNEQETYRRGNRKNQYDAVDTIVQERVARELYLKPFEMIVRGSQVKTFMSSFNKINGTFAGGSHELCTGILRDEWGFEGVVVTDWGDMDIVVDGADAVAAGNDVIMPGGPPVIAQVLAGYKEGRVTEEELRKAVENLLIFVWSSAAEL